MTIESKAIYQHILVAVSEDDITPRDNVNLMVVRAFTLGLLHQASIRFVHWIEPLTYPVLEDNAVMGVPGIFDERLAIQVEDTTKKFSEFLKNQAQTAGYDADYTSQLITGSLGDELTELIDKHSIELIIVSNHKKDSLGDKLIDYWQHFFQQGVYEVITKSDCDLLIVKPECKY